MGLSAPDWDVLMRITNIHETKMSGANIENPCVNFSDYQTTLHGESIYLGFQHLQSLETRIVHFISDEREEHGAYTSLENFTRRVPAGIETVQSLIFIRAFRFTGKPKNELFVDCRLLMVNFKPESRGMLLIEEPYKECQLPELKRDPFEDAFDEIEFLGFTVSGSPFNLLQPRYRGNIMVRDLLLHHKKQVKMLPYLISRRHVPTKKGTMFFWSWIDAEGHNFDTTHFPDCLQQYPCQGGGCYLLLGTVEVDYHFPTITITEMAKMPFIPDPRYHHSEKKRFETQGRIREDVSMTSRQPYPMEHEIVLPRFKMKD